ncbi:MAG: sulfite exporter TauE/SafE family protein [Pseudomonadota bacterium]
MNPLLIGAIFCSGFFIESIIGFGGSLVAFSILGFFIDIKELILMAIYTATTASIFVLASDHKGFDQNIFFKSFPYCLVGTIIGAVFFVNNDSRIIIIAFGLFLIFLAAKTMFFDNIKLPKHFSNLVLTIGGISQGIFGIGGPFFAIALKEKFKNKSQMRATLAIFFIFFNLIRICQFSLQGTLTADVFFKLWWIAAPLAISIHLGHLVHKKISESAFKKIVAILATFSGIEFLFKK